VTPDDWSKVPQEAHVAAPWPVPTPEQTSEPDPEERARDLVAGGYQQISSKYRLVARLPPGMTGLEALAKVDPRLAQNFLDNANELAAQQYLRCYPGVDKIRLTYEEFGAFKKVLDPHWKAKPPLEAEKT
jgi:hypothetical protein